MKTLTNEIVACIKNHYLTFTAYKTYNAQEVLESLETAVNKIIEEHENPVGIESYEILNWNELTQLIPDIKVYDGVDTLAGLQGLLNKMEKLKEAGKLHRHTFQQIITNPDGKWLYLFKVIN